jgi:hypothetical protein
MGQTETNRHVRVTSGFTPIADINMGQIARVKRLGGQTKRAASQSKVQSPRVNPSYHPYAREGQAVVCPLLRGRSPTRSVAPKQHRAPR